MVQRRAARFVRRDYRQTTSVSSLLDQLGWPSLLLLLLLLLLRQCGVHGVHG